MDRKREVNPEAHALPGRTTDGQTTRRRFLTNAGKCGGAVVGAAYIPGAFPRASASQQQAGSTSDEQIEVRPVEEKGAVRILGVVQRRPGLTRKQVKFRSPSFDFSEADRALIAGTPNPTADRRRPTSIGQYYAWVFSQLTKNLPGKDMGHIHNVVLDGAFGVDGEACTAFGNRDLVTEFSYARDGQKPAPADRPAPVPPDSLEPGTALNLVVEQKLAQGTRPMDPPDGNQRAMHFLRLSSKTPADVVRTWQALHAKAMETPTAFGGDVQGHELLQRLADTPARQTIRCGGDIAIPDLVSCFWPKTPGSAAFQTAFENYVRAFRQADKEGVVDHANSFFLVVEEFYYTS